MISSTRPLPLQAALRRTGIDAADAARILGRHRGVLRTPSDVMPSNRAAIGGRSLQPVTERHPV